MERLSERTLGALVEWTSRVGLVLFIDSDGDLKIYPKTNTAWRTLQAMLSGRHPEMKMYLIRATKRGET